MRYLSPTMLNWFNVVTRYFILNLTHSGFQFGWKSDYQLINLGSKPGP